VDQPDSREAITGNVRHLNASLNLSGFRPERHASRKGQDKGDMDNIEAASAR
jgi:hypothetical protein